jgi:flagellum-specific ATP synthase
MLQLLNHIQQNVSAIKSSPTSYGRVSSVVGLLIEATGLQASLGELFLIHVSETTKVEAEVVGVRGQITHLMPLDRTEGMKTGVLVEPYRQPLTIPVGESMLGRVVDANAQPIDGKGPLGEAEPFPVHNDPPGPMERENIDSTMRTGVRAIDAFVTTGKGQRMGIFAGSGVGKSVLMGMIAKQSGADVNVIALIGERGREVREFVEDSLGPEGLKRSIVVAVTSDKAAMSRIKGAYVATAIAEYFRDRGNDVMLMMDSVTRVAMAQREIGLASGEPPTTKGYTPSVFALLPRLLERAGRTQSGSITGLYTILVDNDDMNEPIADAVRSIIDGHIVLSRDLAHKNHYPAIDVLESVSRVMPKIVTNEQRKLAQSGREILATYREAEDLVNIGAYVKGSNPAIDKALGKIDQLNNFLQQDMYQHDFDAQLWRRLADVVGSEVRQQQQQQTQAGAGGR